MIKAFTHHVYVCTKHCTQMKGRLSHFDAKNANPESNTYSISRVDMPCVTAKLPCGQKSYCPLSESLHLRFNNLIFHTLNLIFTHFMTVILKRMRILNL